MLVSPELRCMLVAVAWLLRFCPEPTRTCCCTAASDMVMRMQAHCI